MYLREQADLFFLYRLLQSKKDSKWFPSCGCFHHQFRERSKRGRKKFRSWCCFFTFITHNVFPYSRHIIFILFWTTVVRIKCTPPTPTSSTFSGYCYLKKLSQCVPSTSSLLLKRIPFRLQWAKKRLKSNRFQVTVLWLSQTRVVL